MIDHHEPFRTRHRTARQQLSISKSQELFHHGAQSANLAKQSLGYVPLNTNIETLNDPRPGEQETQRPMTGESHNHLRIEDGQMKARNFAYVARKASPASQPANSQQTSTEFQNFLHIKDKLERTGQYTASRSGPGPFSSSVTVLNSANIGGFSTQ